MTEELFREDSYAQTCAAVVTAVRDGGVMLDRTVFYGASGGQPGDRGTLTLEDGTKLVVTTTTRDGLHVLAQESAEATLPAVGAVCQCAIDWDYRYRLMRMHTSMHLLCACLPYDVTGGQMAFEKSRLDFNLAGESVLAEALTEQLQALVRANAPVSHRWISRADLEANPALVRTAMVQPPAGARVRLVSIGENGAIDEQPCGGTHVAATGEVGRVRVRKIESKGQRNRRVTLVLDDD